MQNITRRGFFQLGVRTGGAVAIAAALTACGNATQGGASTTAGACADPEAMSPSDNSLRQANQYVEKSADAARTCAGCTFFTAAADGGNCGTCQIFTGGPANAQGHCASWAARPAAAG
jgi:High potential iron-sulfur protein